MYAFFTHRQTPIYKTRLFATFLFTYGVFFANLVCMCKRVDEMSCPLSSLHMQQKQSIHGIVAKRHQTFWERQFLAPRVTSTPVS